MQDEYRDFIGIYKNAFSSDFCKHVVTHFDGALGNGAGHTRQEVGDNKHYRSDTCMDSRSGDMFTPYNGTTVNKVFFSGLQECFENYTSKHSVLKEFNLVTNFFKIQKTTPGEGYHIWHCEHGPEYYATRVLVFMLYLNTLDSEEAGETEFLYQQRRVKPEEGTMVIWPAAFTHTHRGNTVHGKNNKYVITGWFHIE